MVNIEHLLLVISVLLLFSVLAGKVSVRAGVPPLLLFLLLGMLAGPEGLGHIEFNDPWVAQLVGTIALVLILFSGGVDTDWPNVRPIVWAALSLSTFGVLFTAALVAWFATLALRFSWIDGLLLGAIVSATDAAAVFAVMRVSHVGLTGRLLPLLELESGTNDPMAIFLTIGLTELLTGSRASVLHLVLLFVEQMGIGAILGLGLGLGMVWVVNWLKLEVTGLYPVLSTTLVFLIFSLTASLQGSGFLAVYVAGLIVGNSQVTERPSLALFHSGLASLMEVAMFLTLGLLVIPSRLPAVADVGLLITLFLIVVARPVSVFVALALARLRLRDKVFVSWVGLRGAVPIVLATFPLLAGVPKANIIFDIVFFIVLVSVLVQGPTIPYVARWLGVAAPAQANDESATPAAQ